MGRMQEPNFKNRTLYHGDNLAFLQGIDSGTVHLIATDPPFNKGRDFHATPDSLAAGGKFEDRWSWDEDVHDNWIDAIKDDRPAVLDVVEMARRTWGDDMGAFLCYMGVRLMEMERILRIEGSIYFHCDRTAVHYLKAIMDAIFGMKNFVSEIIWNYGSPSGGRSAGKKPVKSHESILIYAKRYGKHTYNQQYLPYSDKYVNERFLYTDDDGRRYRTRKRAGGKVERQYLDESKGVPLSTVWSDIKQLYAYHLAKRKQEEYGYKTQKPLALYARIIEAASNPGDIVLDPFCGCATTPIAAERLGRQWIGMDLWDGAQQAIFDRLESEGLASPDGSNGDRLLSFGQIHYETEPPARTDDGEIAAPPFELKLQRQKPRWQRLTHAQIREYLAEAQRHGDGVICGGCGRVLEIEFMELDHIRPKKDGGENYITNRLLLCGPCNRKKEAGLTLTGLRDEHPDWIAGGNLELADIACRNASERAWAVVAELS